MNLIGSSRNVLTAAAIGVSLFALASVTSVSASQTVSITELSASASSGSSGPTSVACMSPGNCIASGYTDNNRATLQTERNGKWGPPTDPTKKLGKIANSILITTSCYASGCVALGRYNKALNPSKIEHFTVAYSGGHWTKATSLTLNLGAANAFQEFKLYCSDQYNCVVVGTLRYSSEFASTPIYAPAVLTEKAGQWGVPRPLAARTSSVGRLTEFLDVSCPGADSCVAVGIVNRPGFPGDFRAWMSQAALV